MRYRVRKLVGGLRDAGDQNAVGQGENLPLQAARHASGEHQHRGDHHHVQQRGAQGGDEEKAPRVEHAHENRRQAHPAHVREHDDEQLQHEPHVALRIGPRQIAADAEQDRGDHHQRGHQEAGDHRVGHLPHGRLALRHLFVLQEGQEGRSERPFAEQAAEEIGNHEGEVERTLDRTGAQEMRVDHFPEQAQNPAGNRGGRHGGAGFQHL